MESALNEKSAMARETGFGAKKQVPKSTASENPFTPMLKATHDFTKFAMSTDAAGKIKDGIENAAISAQNVAAKTKLENFGVAIGGGAGILATANGALKTIDAKKDSEIVGWNPENSSKVVSGVLGATQGILTGASSVMFATVKTYGDRILDGLGKLKPVGKSLLSAKTANIAIGAGLAGEFADGVAYQFDAVKKSSEGKTETARIKREQAMTKGLSTAGYAAILYGVPQLASKLLGYGKTPSALVAGAMTIGVAHLAEQHVDELEKRSKHVDYAETQAKRRGVPLSAIIAERKSEEDAKTEARIAPVAKIRIQAEATGDMGKTQNKKTAP